MFYHKTMNFDQYITNILEPFFEDLTDDEREHAYFQQNNATVQTTRNSVSALQEVFDESIIITELRSPRSPNLSVCDFYLWGEPRKKIVQEHASHS